MIQGLRPTSKASLKLQCLQMCKGKLDEAEKLYDFMIKDMDELPMFDYVPPTTMQQVKDSAINTFKWLNDNQEQVMNWVGIIKQMFGKGGGIPPTGASGQALPPIN